MYVRYSVCSIHSYECVIAMYFKLFHCVVQNNITFSYAIDKMDYGLGCPRFARNLYHSS